MAKTEKVHRNGVNDIITITAVIVFPAVMQPYQWFHCVWSLLYLQNNFKKSLKFIGSGRFFSSER